MELLGPGRTEIRSRLTGWGDVGGGPGGLTGRVWSRAMAEGIESPIRGGDIIQGGMDKTLWFRQKVC